MRVPAFDGRFFHIACRHIDDSSNASFDVTTTIKTGVSQPNARRSFQIKRDDAPAPDTCPHTASSNFSTNIRFIAIMATMPVVRQR
ncbi:hypothetical protein [Aureimonas sp. AU4]|uniref:hypothetical protein n=1 Tax=Aureimonas sp. AU4 TaxID=1638163 RepID=UPI000AB30FB3|nr:hypothetical protein [Aureimonas sp. AU4]